MTGGIITESLKNPPEIATQQILFKNRKYYS